MICIDIIGVFHLSGKKVLDLKEDQHENDCENNDSNFEIVDAIIKTTKQLKQRNVTKIHVPLVEEVSL
jgi:hypothetical protein